MPVYKLNSKIFDIPDNLIGEFEKDNPNASIAYEAEGNVYDIPVSKKSAFLKQFPKASLYNEGTTSPAESSLSPEASAMIDELKAKIRDVKPVQRESSLQELVDRQREADKQSSRRLPQLRQEVARPDAIRQEQIILPVEHSDRNDEERDIDSRFKPREAASPEDIYSNYIDRFALTRRGQELQSELVDIQRGVNDRYAGEFLQSDEYRALADRYTGQELNNKANEDFNRIYGERINKDMQPYIMAYQDEVLKRYGDRINEDMKQLTKEQVAGDIDKLSASVGKQLGDAHSRLSQQGGTGGNVMNVLMGSRRYNTDKAINAERRQLGELEVAQNLLNDSKEIIAEAQKRGNTNFMAGLGRGLYDTVFDADTWSMGLTDLREGKLLMDVLDKFDRGERLNDSEQALMDAAVANLATNAYYYSDLGRGYKAGMTTGQSIPFMLEFAINPVSGSGSAIAKSILRYGMKKFGAKTAKRGVSRMAARLAGDALAATGLTGTTGSARVAAGTMERMTGDIQLDNTGRHYAGRTGQQSAGEALGKSFASSFLENQSEMVFNAFKGFGPVVWAQAERVLPGGVGSLMDDALTGKTWNFYRKLKSSPVLVEAAKRTQFHGLFGEYAEELYNNFANIPLGEMTLEEATDLDNNIDTFLGLAPTSVAFSLLGLGGLAHERYRYRRQKQRMLGQMTEEEREKMTKLEELSKERGNEDIKRFIKETITATNLTPEEKKQEIAYAYNIAVNNALDDVDKARKQEVRNNHDASFREGQAIYEEHDPTQMRQTVLRREVALERLTGMGIDEQSIQELSEIPVEEREEKLSTYTDDVRDAALDYLNALDREAGMNDAMDKAHAGEVEHARNLLGEITASGGNVTLVPLGKYGSKDAQWGVVVKGLDANGMPTQSNGALMVYPIQMDNNVPVFSSINEDSPLTVIPESMIDAMIVSPDDALRGMLSSYQQDADIQEGTPIAPQSSFPILDEAGAVQTVTVLGNDGAGNWILQMPDGSVSSPIADDVLRKRKRDAEVAPILQEYAAASQVQEEARKEVDKEESVAQQKGTTTPQTAAVPKPKVGDRFTVDGKTAVVKEIAPDGIIVDYVNEEGDITGADQLTFSTYSEALSLLKTASEYTPSTGATSTSGEQSGIGTTEQSPKSQQRALDRIPKDEKGQPLYEQADPETAWDAIVEQAGGDEAMASSIVSDLVNERKKAYDAAAKNLKIVEAGKPQAKKGDGEPTMEERVEAKREARKMLELARAEVERTRNAYDTWQRIAQVKQQREKAIREPKEDGQNEIRPAMSSNSQIAENSAIPVDKDGKPLYHTVPVDVTLADLNDGSLDANEVDAFIEENAKAALQLLKKTSEKPPKIGTDKAKYLADKQAWQARVDDALAQVDYWQQVADELAARRERPGDRTAAEILAMGEPMDGEELAAQMLANGSLPLLRESYLRETGAGNEEARSMLGLFASKEKGGLTIEQAGEKLMLADSENGTHFFDPNDANAGRDALISVLSVAKTRGDLTNFIRNRRAEQARREQEAEREAYDSWCEANFHMSAEEYEAYENEFLPLVGESLLTEEQYVEFISIFGEELNRRNDETRRIDTENTSNEPGRAAGIPERSGTVLSEEETVPSGRAGTTETQSTTVGTSVGTADGAVQGSASGREERISRTTIDPRLMTETERKRRGDMLRNASAVDVEVGQIVSTPELSARKVAEKWWDANVPEPVFYDTEVGEVEINKNSVESSLAHRYSQAKLDAITSLVDGFENAVYLGTLPDGRERGVIDHYFAYPIEYKGKRNYVFCRVMQDANKNRLYVHEVFVAENIKKGDTLQTAASKPHGGIALYKDILANVLGETVTKTEPQQSSNAVSTGSSLSENEGDGITSSEPNGEPTVSFHKNTDKSTVTQTIGEKIAQAEAETDTNPTDGQKEAGNYKKGHVRIGQFDITVENPKGSVRRGTDANGNPWQTTMHNTYGYIRGTEGVDGDHIDVFLTDDIDGWNGRRVYVVDQYNEDGTFDEHKVMLGFNDEADARDAYFSNYSKGWADNRKIVMTSTNLEDFEKWIDSSHRKTKPFAEYKSVQNAEVVASKAESDIEAATDEKEVNEAVRKIDEQLDKVNEQLALLGYYEAEPVESDFNEAYGYMRNAEKKAVKDANNLANRLAKDLGIDPETIVDNKGKRRRSIATANIAPIGGNISIHLPLGEKRELYISIRLDNQEGDNLKVTGGMLRIENPTPERGEERYLSSNNFFAEDETYQSLLHTAQQLVKHYAPDFVPVSNSQQEASSKAEKKPSKQQRKQKEPKIVDLFSAQEENVTVGQDNSSFQKGDAVIYQGKPATVYDIEDNGRLVLDTGLAPVLYESADPKEVKPANTATLHVENTEINRMFANAVKTDMLTALDSGTKPYRSILDLRKRAAALGMEVDHDGRTDILLQELVEDGLVRAAREVVEQYGRDSKESYDLICKLYDMQPTIAARSSNRIKMQQYSTPLPMAWNAARFAMSGKKGGKVLEPTAGNGMLVFAVPANQVHVNELDETRLDNLREQGFAQVTQQDATEPFEGGQQYDVIIANPPFGKRNEVEYDGKMIPGLDPQITLNALASMKDNGKAAIIIGGNMEYGNNGGLKSMKPFFTYLYDHYNVKGVVDMDGKLYSKQGTTFPTRMILIAGRRSDEERVQTAVYPPVESKAIRKADSFDDLYDIIDKVINSKEKTNGTEILRSQQGQLVSVADQPSRNTDGTGHSGQSRKNDDTGHGQRGTAHSTESNSERSQQVLSREHRTDTGNGETRRGAGGNTEGGSRGISEPDVQRVGTVGVSTERVGLGETRTEQPKKRTLTEEKSAYRPHNSAFSLQSVAPAAMVEAMDNVLTQIETENGNIDEFVRKELGYDTIEETHQALAAEQIDSVAMAIYQMKQGQALIIGDQTGVGKGRQMAALIRWAVKRGEKPIFITQKADLFSDIYRDLVDIGSGDLVPFIFNSDGAMVDSNGNTVHKPLSSKEMAKVFATGQLPDEYDFAVLTYSQVNTGDEVSQKEAEEAAKKRGGRTKKSKASKDGKATPKATFLRAIAEDNYLFLDESHTAAGTSNTGAYLQSILRSAKAATFASATFAKRPDTMPLYAIRTAMSQAKVEPDKLIGIIEKGGVTLQEIMSRELTNAGQMVRRERDMSDVVTDWKTINDPATVKRARENYDHTIAAFNAIIKFQEDYVKPMVDAMDKELAVMAESAGIKRGTDKMGVENVPFASKTYNYTKQLMLALKVDAIADEVEAEIKAGRHPVIALESTMESTIKDYSPGDIIEEPTFSASLLKGLDTVMQYTVKDENGKEQHARYSPKQLGEAGEKAYYELQDFIRESTSDIFISPLDAIIERLHGMGYKVGELTGRNVYVERDDDGRVVVRRRTDKDKKRMQREFNSGELDVLILNKSASTGISLHASEKFSDQRQRTMIIAQPLSDINDYMQMIGRIDRTGQVHRGYYINLGLPVPAENRFLMMLSTKLKSLNANTTTSQDSESNEVEAPDLLNKYGSQVVVEYLRDNPEIYEKMGSPLKKAGQGGGRVQTNELDEYKPQEDDARKITGYVALLTTKEQEEFYDDVVRRYNELIKYLNDTGSNDLKITVMPLRAKTLNKRVSSEGIDPTGTNPFARNSYVEQVEMDVLRKPMKAAEIRKTIEQVNKGKRPEDYVRQLIATIDKEDEARIAAEEARYERSKVRAQEDIAKQTDKINRQQKRTAEEKQAAIADYARETNENVESKHNDNMVRLNTNSDMLKQRLHMFEVGKSYLMPDNLESTVFDFSTPAIFCGYKAKDSKITASTTLAVFATLDGRRRMEIKLSQPEALRSIYKTTNDNWDAARSTTLENWDSQIPTGTRKTGFIMTGNILQAIADTQDEYGGYPGQLISYTDIDGNVHDGILMPDKWNTSMLKTSGAPIISRLKQIKDYMPVTSHDGKVDITGSSWAKVYYLTVPKTKKDGAVYYENKALLRAVNGSNFYPYRGKLRADIPAENIEKVVRELSKLGVKVKEETNEDDALYRLDDYTTNEEEANDLFRVVDDASEIERLNSEPTVKVYRAMSLVDGKLYPPMSKKIGTGSNRISQAPSEFGQWEVSDERPELVEKEGAHKNHIYIVKDNGKGLWVAYNPYFHTSRNPLNDQFAEAYQRPNLVTVEVEVPESELTSGYQAEGAKDSVGETKWNAGPVNRQLSGDKKRKVILSRWMRPVRIVPDSEVAQRIAELIEGENVAIPDNTVTPSLLEELKKLGVKIVDGISKGRKKATAMLRGGDGMLTDDELSYENDPVAKMTGRSTRTAAQRRAFAIRERQRMVTAVQELAEKLHLDNVDIVTDASTLQGERAKAKGFYSRSTGRITIVISNHRSVFDAEQTLLHEAVAHYGLRQLFGSHFNTFLDNVFRNADEAIRQKIVDLSKKHNWNIHTATEEYLASLAENTDFENINASWWQKIKELFLNMLHKIGFEDFSGVTLSDNELRYILWRSYENLAEPGRYRSILGTAVDTRKQYELGVGNFASSVEADTRVAESTDRDDDVRFRFSDRPAIIQEYDKAVSTNEFRFQEAFQDSMLSLKLLQNVIEKYSKKRIRSFENAYTAENRLSSLNKIDNERYIKNYFEPLLDVVKKLSDKYGRQKVEDYIYAKSGLERNDVLLHRDAKAAYDEGKAELDDKLDKGKINQDQYDVLMQQVQADYEKKLAEGGDYSGLEGLVLRDQQDQLDEDLKNQVIDKLEYNRRIKEIKAQYKTHAEELVRDFESEATQEEIDSLWQHINNATNATLDKLLESGMLSQERYEEIKNMMQYYVPLKGWQEDIAEDVYDYTRRETPVQKEKKAKGRKSLADNPIAQIALSAQNAIILGNRNKMKQRFYNFVINRPNELAVIANVWYAHTYNTVHGQVEKVYPDINENDSPETIMQKMDDFEKRMQKEKEEGRAYRGKVPFGMELKTKSGQRPEHFVSLMINGIEYVIYINGDPRAAQALNGKTNPEGEENIFWEYYNRLKRLYGGGLTSNNPDFVAANFVRDTIQSATMEYMNKGFLASAHYLRNIPKSFAAVSRGVFEHYNPNRQTDVYFKEFIENGGETGYTAVHTIEDYKKEYERALQEIRGIRKTFSMTRDGLNAVIKCLETANRIAEDVNRFNAYMSSRQAGYGIEDSIDAAKNISVNFNKKGALGKGKGVWAALAWFMNKWILFFNPAVQGLYQVGQAAKNHKKRVLKTLGTIMASGFVMPMLNELLVSALGGGDDDDYFNQTDYTRMNNWLIYLGGGYIKIPLPPLFREVYGLGDILYRVLTNRMTPEKAAVSTARQVQSAVGFINLIPEGEPSVQEAVGGLMPDLVAPFMDVAFNRDFMGHDIAKVTDYTKNLPEYERVYKGVSPVYVEISRILNNVGGNDALRSHFWGTFINPAYMEHIITSYTGGIGKTMSNLTGMVVDVTTGDWGNIEPRTIPVVNRFINPVTEKTVTAAVNRVFYEYRDRYEELRVAEKRYKQFINDGRTEFKDEFEQMQESGEIEFINYFKQKMKTLRKMEDRLKDNPGDKELEMRIREFKAGMIMKAKEILK